MAHASPYTMRSNGLINTTDSMQLRSPTKKEIEMNTASKVKSLYDYLMARAAYEKVDWALSKEFFTCGFDFGIRGFFGVQIDDDGTLLNDVQQPEFFATYNSTNVSDKQKSPRRTSTRAPRKDCQDA